MQPKSALHRRLEPYWKMEAACAVLIPAAALWIAFPRSEVEAVALTLGLLASSALLALGALYWRVVLRRADGDAIPMTSILKSADRMERPVLALLGAAVIATIVAGIRLGPTTTVIAAAICTALAALEYVNYYRVQLQNFDHAPDLRRLLRGRGLRRAHLARDLAAYRRSGQ